MSRNLISILNNDYGVDEATFIEAINDPKNASAKGSILGSISEVLLKRLLSKEFETKRIKEKPDGGFDNKNNEARGDFYIRNKKSNKNSWIVVECKGLKSNAEKHAHNFYDRKNVFNFLNKKLFKQDKNHIYERGYKTYLNSKKNWEAKNKNKKFPNFSWNKNSPGLETYNLKNLWKNPEHLYNWVYKLPDNLFDPKNVDIGKGAIKILMTHMPSTRIGINTDIKSTGPLKGEFGILALDLFIRTGYHKFVFASSYDLNHQPGSPEHLSQNYTIDIVPHGIKGKPIITFPWYENINDCIIRGNPIYRKLDETQLDQR